MCESRRYYQYTITCEHDILELIQLINWDSTNANNNQNEQRKRQQRQMELMYNDITEEETRTAKRSKHSNNDNNNNNNRNVVNRLALLINGCSETTATSWYELAETLLTFSSVSNHTNLSLQSATMPTKPTKEQSIFPTATTLFNYNTIKYIDITCSNCKSSELVQTIISVLLKPIVLSTLTKSILIDDTNDNQKVAKILQHRTKELIVKQFSIKNCHLIFSTTSSNSSTTTLNTALSEVLSIPSLSFHNVEIMQNKYSSITTTTTFDATPNTTRRSRTVTLNDDYFPLLVKALQSNKILKYLNLSRSNLCGVNTTTSISNMLYWNTSIQHLNLSFNAFRSNELVLISKSVRYQPTLQILNISYHQCNINNTDMEFEEMFSLVKYNEILLKLIIDGWTSTRFLTMLAQCMKYNNTIQEVLNDRGIINFETCRQQIREYPQERSLLRREDSIFRDNTFQRENMENVLGIVPDLLVSTFLFDLFGDVIPHHYFLDTDADLQDYDVFDLIASPCKGRRRRNDTFNSLIQSFIVWGGGG